MNPERVEPRLNPAERINLALIVAEANETETPEGQKAILNRLAQWFISLEQKATLHKILKILGIEGKETLEKDAPDIDKKFLAALKENHWPPEEDSLDLQQLKRVALKQGQFPRPRHGFLEGIDVEKKTPAELLGPLQTVLVTLEKSGYDLQHAVTLSAHTEDSQVEADAGFRKALMQGSYLLVRAEGRPPFLWSIWVSSDPEAPIYILRHTADEPRMGYHTQWKEIKASAGDRILETRSREKTLGQKLASAIENHRIDLQTGIVRIDGHEAVGLSAYGRALTPPVDHESLLDWVKEAKVRPIPEVISRQKGQKTTRLYWKKDIDKIIPPLLDKMSGCLTIRAADDQETVAVELARYANAMKVCPRTLQRWVTEDPSIQPLPRTKACGVKNNGERYLINTLYSKESIDRLLQEKGRIPHPNTEPAAADLNAPASTAAL